jgi:cell division protease FtsH
VRKNYFVWLVLLLGLLFIYNASQQNNVTPTSYSAFEQQIDQVSKFELSNDTRSFLYMIEDKPTVFTSTFPTPDHAARSVDALIANGVSIYADPPKKASFLATFFFSFFPVLILVAVLIWIYKRNSGGGGVAGAFSKSPATLVDHTKNTVTLKDVAGNPGDFDDVFEIIDFLKDPVKYHAANAKLPKGLLMYGPPGVGKTLLARAIAGEAGVPFFTINGSAFVEMFVGVGASRVRDMFTNLREHQPAILFIDEIDALGGARMPGGYGGGHREAEQTLNQLLTEMDGFENDDAIMVIAATNRPDTLDPALLRPGRFDRLIPINLPDVKAREQILEVHTKGRDLDGDVDLNVIAKGTPGMSGADLANLINEAAMIIGKDNRTVIEMKDLEAARDKIFMGREKTLAMSDKEKEMTAYHEAGHAIAAYDMPGHDPVYKITIIPRDRALGVTMYLPGEDKYSIKQHELKAQLVSLMGGRAAEEEVYGEENISTGASNDLERATELARNMVTKWGFSNTGLISFRDHDYDLLSDDTKELIDNQVREKLEWAYSRAKEILSDRREKLNAVATRLIDKETIDFDEFKEIMEDDGTLLREATPDSSI